MIKRDVQAEYLIGLRRETRFALGLSEWVADTQHGSNVNMGEPVESPERGARIAALACVSGAAQRFAILLCRSLYAARAAVHRPEQPSMSTRQEPDPEFAPSRPEPLAVARLCWISSTTAPF